jgi:uncharacterized protein YbcV (DUF1398 family)
MDAHIVEATLKLSLAEQITFPEVVMRLAQSGTERYLVDITGQRHLAWGTEGSSHVGAYDYDAGDIPLTFDAAAVKAAITDIQHGRIKYLTFMDRIVKAGCCHYWVFISGKQAIYFGRDGSQHIERFPSAP